jgi:hypothetical protein
MTPKKENAAKKTVVTQILFRLKERPTTTAFVHSLGTLETKRLLAIRRTWHGLLIRSPASKKQLVHSLKRAPSHIIMTNSVRRNLHRHFWQDIHLFAINDIESGKFRLSRKTLLTAPVFT